MHFQKRLNSESSFTPNQANLDHFHEAEVNASYSYYGKNCIKKTQVI